MTFHLHTADYIPAKDLPQSNQSQSHEPARNWYAVHTIPQNEKSTVKHLDAREIESFLPTYECSHVWKNQQRVKVTLPLFPTYLFVRIQAVERSAVLAVPGVIRILGDSRGPISLPESDVEFLRSDFVRERIGPYRDLVVGQTVRIKSGPMQGIQGILMRKKTSLRFVLTLELLNQHASVEVAAEELEPVVN